MKKVLLSLVAVGVSALFAAAETVTFDFSDPSTWGYTGTPNQGTDYDSEKPITVAPITIAVDTKDAATGGGKFRFWYPQNTSNAKDFRCSANGGAKKQTLTFTADGNTITEIVFTAAKFALTANTGTLSAYASKTATWTGSAKEIVFTTSGANTLNKVVVTYTKDSGDTREPAELAWSESSVTLCADELDSFTAPTLTNPHSVAVTYASDNSAVATVTEAGAVTLTGTVGTAKITAKFDGNTTYREQEVSYTITVKPAPTAVTTVTETIALPDGTAVKVNYPLTVAFVNHSNVFACDEDGDFIQLYGSNTLKAGDVIPAGWVGTYKLYNNTTPEIEFEALPTATEGTFTPKTVAATDITTALVNHVITIKNVDFDEATPATKTNFTGNVGETEISFRNNYSLESVEAGKYDVTVVVTIYNQAPSLYVVSYAKSETDSALLIGAGDNAAPVEYYNLQGVRIDNPANGIFIRRQGSKAQKIVL